MSFIQRIASFIREQNFELRNLTIVVPSQRATKYLANALVAEFGGPIFAPNMVTIDQWVKSYYPNCIDNTRLLLKLYEVHQEIVSDPETFEDFVQWATMLINDFDDIDKYLLNPKDVFKNLHEIKELEAWNLEENEMSDIQRKFLDFWEKLPDYHEKLFVKLNEQGKITSANAYRKLAESDLNFEGHHIFAGFNALSNAESTIIRKLLRVGKADFFIDADDYYLNDNIHEAGTFIRKSIQALELKNPNWTGNKISSSPMNLRIVECPQKTGQVKVAASELASLSKEELDRTAIILADETLISALVQNIPSHVEQANITLGLPLTHTPIRSWVETIFRIQENKKRFKTSAIYHSDLIGFLHQVFILVIATEREKKSLAEIEFNTSSKNKVFQSPAKLNISQRINEILIAITTDWKDDWQLAIKQIRLLNELLISFLSPTNEFELNCLTSFDVSINAFDKIVHEGLPTMTLKSFKSLFFQHWSSANLSYHGNPTKGLQIMGILETRLLDFERIMILGFNEGSLPTNNSLKSLIPLDLRNLLGLPSTRDKQGVFAHHFYRLLHEAKQVTATYSSTSDQLGSQEKSRYLLQLELELPLANKNFSISREMYSVPLNEVSKIELGMISKSSFIIDRVHQFFQRTISASSINKYNICPLDFYYRYLVEFGEEKSVEEDIETHTFGTFIHNTLDALYQPYSKYNKEGELIYEDPPAITEQIIEGMMASFPEKLTQEFINYFDGDAILFQTGKNALSFAVAKEMTMKFLEAEKQFVKKSTEPLFIERLESRFDTSFQIEINGEQKTIKIGGYIDRVDKVGEKYRVIDYKSGKVKEDNVTLSESNGKLNFRKTKFAVQLAFYALMFEEKYNVLPDEVLILSLIDPKRNYILKGNKNESLQEISEEVKLFIKELYEEMTDKTIDFMHDKYSYYCQFCS